MIGGHGGNIHELSRRLGCSPADITDLSSNVNPLGPPPACGSFWESSWTPSRRCRRSTTAAPSRVTRNSSVSPPTAS